MIQKYRIGKNGNGWYLTIPTWWGTFNVLEGIPTFEDAVEVFNQHRYTLQ